MDYNITYRKKDNGIQVIISYKDELGKWKQKSKQGFPDDREGKKNAKIAADKMLQEIKEKVSGGLSTEYSDITLKQFIDMYLEHKRIYSAIKTNEVLTSSLKSFTPIYDKKLNTITNLDIQKCVDLLAEKDLKEISVKSYLCILATVFNSAINDYNILLKSPVKNIRVKKTRPTEEKKALTESEFDTLVKTFRNSKFDNYVPIILIAGTCGLRIGEILGLTWNDVDFKEKTLTVNKQWKIISLDPKTFGFGDLKSKNSYRTVPVSPSTLEYLKNLKNTQSINYMNRIIKNKSTLGTDAFLNRKFKELGFNITIHELRHTYATKLIGNGADFKTVAKILGHDVNETMKTYSHVNDDMMKRTSNLISKIF